MRTAALRGFMGTVRGTTAAGLSAGVPSIVVPFTVDQPFWGSRVVSLGVGPTPIPQRGSRRQDSTQHSANRWQIPPCCAGPASSAPASARKDGLAAAIDVYERALGSRAASAK
ncbi:hypothetical protein [Salinibacterium sp.]|uniref:glycosyltransferase n=1 Tax=Salinibacterium sp. TaxID=1915057 RepID=UPI00286B6042|nr:hypothetical protein [Salinibacterium sp.]